MSPRAEGVPESEGSESAALSWSTRDRWLVITATQWSGRSPINVMGVKMPASVSVSEPRVRAGPTATSGSDWGPHRDAGDQNTAGIPWVGRGGREARKGRRWPEREARRHGADVRTLLLSLPTLDADWLSAWVLALGAPPAPAAATRTVRSSCQGAPPLFPGSRRSPVGGYACARLRAGEVVRDHCAEHILTGQE